MEHRIFVGLSGGVDSAVSAALLKERGHNVVGAFIKIWSPEFIECTWKEDRLDAMRVCASLRIPFYEVDLSAEYKRGVVDAMLADYASGITPNPDVLCNRHIKFGAFLQWARSQGASAIATGHYAQIVERGGHFSLLRGVDQEKDQSYFLHRLGQQELAHTFFPVGGMKKADVRAYASTLGLPVAHKPDSQGLCFVGDVSMPDFLRRFLPLKTGSVLDSKGMVIGHHEGAALYTLGERHGFTITDPSLHGAHYVVAIDTNLNTITVSQTREDAAVLQVTLERPHWIYRIPESDMKLEAQARYRGPRTPITLEHRAQGLTGTFSEARLAPPGQSLVIYKDDECLGGGVIASKRTRAENVVHSGAFSSSTG